MTARLRQGLLAAVLVLAAASSAAAGFRHGVVYYGDGNASVWETVAARYDFGILGYESYLANDAFEVKARNPGFRWFTYNSITDNYVAVHSSSDDLLEHQDLVTRANARGWDVEDAYLHFADDTEIDLGGRVVFVPGWGEGTATSPAQARVPVFYSDLTRRATHLAGRGGILHRESIVARHFDTPIGETNVLADGVFLDNSAHQLWNTGRIRSGGHVVEAGGLEVGTSAFDAWHWSRNLRPFLVALRDTAEILGREVMINIADAWSRDYVDFHVADHLAQEGLYSPVLRHGPGRVMESRGRDEDAAAAGMTTFHLSFVTASASGGSGSYDYEEAALGSVAWWLTTRTPGTALFLKGTYDTARPTWAETTWSVVIDSAQARLGEPAGAPAVVGSGRDPLGYDYDVVGRAYAGGMTLVRNRGAADQDIGPGTAVTVSLPEPMRRLGTDGAPGQVVTEITLRNGEGAILVRPEQSGGDPDPDPDPSPGGIEPQWTLTWVDASPQPSATGVPPTVEIRCLFSEPLAQPDPSWITATGSVTGPGAGAVFLEDGGRRLVYRPAAAWSAGETVTVDLSPAIATPSGARMDGDGDGTGTGQPGDRASFSFSIDAP